jgi:hypothetical protein
MEALEGMAEESDSMSKSKPSTTAEPKGRGTLATGVGGTGPKASQRKLANLTADSGLATKTLALSPPRDSKIFFPFCWQVMISASMFGHDAINWVLTLLLVW